MERSSKRRRIAENLEQIFADRSTTVEDHRTGLFGNLIKEGSRLPRFVLPPSADKALQVEASLHQDAATSFGSTERSDFVPQRLEAPPYSPGHHANIANKVIRQVAVEPITNRAANMAGPTTIDHSDNPSPNTAPEEDTHPAQKAPPEQHESTNPGTTRTDDKNSHAVDDIPGLVTPLPAEAAASARKKALQSQDTGADEYDRAGAQSAVGISLPAAGSQPGRTQSVFSDNFGGKTSQHVLGTPSTSLPSSLKPTLTSPSYFPSSTTRSVDQHSDQSSRNPTPSSRGMSRVHDAQQSSTHDSTVSKSTSAQSQTSDKSSDIPSATGSSRSTSTAESSTEAAISRHSLTASLSISTASSAYSALSTERNSFSPSSTATTLLTKMASSSRLTSSRSPSMSTIDLPSSTSQPFSSGSTLISTSPSNGIGAAGNGNNSNPAPTQSPTSTPSAVSGGGGAPPTPVLVGSIVGGLAGLVMIILALLFLLRWRRGKVGQRRLISPPMAQNPTQAIAGQSGTGTQRSSNVPIATAGFFGRLRPSSSQTAATTDTAPSERGFQKLSGRKLESVLQTGGDGYGNMPSGPSGGISSNAGRGVAPGQGPYAGLAPGLRPSPPQSLSGSSFYRDSRGFYGGVVPKDESSLDPTDLSTSATSSSPPPAGGLRSPHGPSRGSEVPNIRPGPARQPVISEPGFLPARNPSRAPGSPPRPVRATPPPIMEHPRDGLGRSHPSQDGSRGSRFTEATTPP